MNYQVSMRCYDCNRAGTAIKFIPEMYSHTKIGCKTCSHKLRLILPETSQTSVIEKDDHILAICFKKP